MTVPDITSLDPYARLAAIRLAMQDILSGGQSYGVASMGNERNVRKGELSTLRQMAMDCMMEIKFIDGTFGPAVMMQDFTS